MLVLKGLRQGVTQVVGGQGALPAVLELGKNTLKGRRRRFRLGSLVFEGGEMGTWCIQTNL